MLPTRRSLRFKNSLRCVWSSIQVPPLCNTPWSWTVFYDNCPLRIL
jgi:hypothetical protein